MNLDAFQGATLLLPLEEALESEAIGLHAEDFLELILSDVLGVQDREQTGSGFGK